MHMGIVELLIVLLIVMIFIGPKQIPKLAETCGKAITSFKRGVKEDSVEGPAAETEKEA